LANPGWKKKKFQKNGDNKFSKDRSNITCYNCGKKGHFSNKCWAPKTNNAYAPKANEANAAKVQNKKKGKKKDGVEVMLCQVIDQLKELPTSVKSLLQDDEIFILDSGAMYNSTFSN
jgi:hypothetical protein